MAKSCLKCLFDKFIWYLLGIDSLLGSIIVKAYVYFFILQGFKILCDFWVSHFKYDWQTLAQGATYMLMQQLGRGIGPMELNAFIVPTFPWIKFPFAENAILFTRSKLNFIETKWRRTKICYSSS